MTAPAGMVAALAYARRGWRVFPCARRVPLIEDWPVRASHNPDKLARWWRRWPWALIAALTGEANGFVVLDIDVKNGVCGRDTLAELGFAILPATPLAHTPSGGLHVYFARPLVELRNTAGKKGRGIGAGLDWRGDGGAITLPSPNSGYRWDAHCNPDTVALAQVPAALLPREPVRPTATRPVKPTEGLSRYAEAALDSACRNIIGAAAGEQHDTLIRETAAIGSLCGAGAAPEAFARDALLWAALQMRSHDPRRPWRPADLRRQVEQSFTYGLARPRARLPRGTI